MTQHTATAPRDEYTRMMLAQGAELAAGHTDCRVNLAGSHRGNLYCISHGVKLIAADDLDGAIAAFEASAPTAQPAVRRVGPQRPRTAR